MSSTIYRIFAVALFLIVSLAGCGKQENKMDDKQATTQEAMPEANPQTCTQENLEKYGTPFADKCFYSGKFTKSSGRGWKF